MVGRSTFGTRHLGWIIPRDETPPSAATRRVTLAALEDEGILYKVSCLLGKS